MKYYACGFPECAERSAEIERLRRAVEECAVSSDKMERLEAEIERLRELLVEIRSWMDGIAMGEWDARFIAKIDAVLGGESVETDKKPATYPDGTPIF